MLADTLTIMMVSGVATSPAAVAVGATACAVELVESPAVGFLPEVRMH